MIKLKLFLLKLLINSTFKYNKEDCRDKYMETTMDDLYFLIEKESV
jgi:hypothetical protein